MTTDYDSSWDLEEDENSWPVREYVVWFANRLNGGSNKSSHGFGHKIRNVFDYQINLLSAGTSLGSRLD